MGSMAKRPGREPNFDLSCGFGPGESDKDVTTDVLLASHWENEVKMEEVDMNRSGCFVV